MQEGFKKACNFPCQVMAMIIEMEHRNEGASYDECVDTMMKVLSEHIEQHKMMPEMMLVAESLTFEEKLMYGDERCRLAKEGSTNEM